MVSPPEVGLLVVVLLGLLLAYWVIRAIKPLIVNTTVGLIVLGLAGWLGYGVAITPVVVLLVAFGGLPAALLVLVLAHFRVLFHPALLHAAL